ncbi:MAG: YceD family protein [Limnohabitans sp.]
MDKTFDLRRLDIQAFAQAGTKLQGETPLAQWPRLLDEQHSAGQTDHCVHWRLQGRMVPVAGGPARIGMTLWAQADLRMQCQRCLTPVVERVLAEREFVFVADEATAQAMDDESEEDVLVLSRDFDALSLIEDELILALPLVPRHEVCPQDLPTTAVDEAFAAASERPSPFAALASLKKPD